MGQAGTRGDRAKVLPEITDIVGLVVVLREQLEHAVVIRLIADLQRIEDHEATAGLEHARELSKDRAAHLGRQLMKHEDARHRVLAFVIQRNGLPVSDEKVDPAPTSQMPLGLSDVSLRHVDPERREARPGLLEEIEKASGAAADVEKPETALIATRKHLVQWKQRLAARCICRAVEQDFHLDIVALG